MRLHLAARFLGGVEGVIEDRYTCFGILPVTIGPVGSEYRTDFLDVFRLGRLAVEIPSSKLHAHDVISTFRSISTP